VAATEAPAEVVRLRTALVAITAFLALLLIAAWQVPQWLDWTRYRTTIEALATATLGQPVVIRGPVSLTLLPQPVLTAADVTVGGGLPTDLSIHVRALRLRIALLPLIGGHVDARELVLRGPDLRIPWSTQSGTLRRPRPPAWLAAFAARTENGRLMIGRLAFTGINASLRTLYDGSLSATGTARFGDKDWHFTARLTVAENDATAGLSMTLDGLGAANGLGASFSGRLKPDGTLAGTVASRGPNLAAFLPAPPVPFRAEGRLTVGSGLAALDDLALEIGGSPASGAAALRVAPTPRLDITVAATRLSLDAWLPVVLEAKAAIAGIEVPIGVNVSAEAATLGGGTLEHVTTSFDLAGKDLVVREANAVLPGNGQLRMTGRITRDDQAHSRFEGDVRLEAPLLRTTLRWLDQAAPWLLPGSLSANLPENVGQRAYLTAHVMVGDGELVLQRMAGTVDDARVAGSLRFKRGDPPSLTMDVSLDRLAFDPWFAQRPVDLAELSTIASGLDAELRFNVRQTTFAGVAIDGLVVDAAIEAGGILLRRMEGTVRGARFLASGMLSDGGRLSDGKLSIQTNDATSLADLLPSAWRPTPALWHGPANLELRLAGRKDALTANVKLALADAQLEATPAVDLQTGVWSAALAVHHPGARRLITTLGLPERVAGLRDLPLWLGDGSFSLLAHLAGKPGQVTAQPFELTAADLHASGDLAIDRSSTVPHLTGHVRAATVTLPLPNGGSDTPFPVAVLHGWRGDLQLAIGQVVVGEGPQLHDVAATASVADGRLRLDDFTAKLGLGTASGRIALDTSLHPPSLAMELNLGNVVVAGPLDDAPIDLLSGRADASVQLTATGYSPSAILATVGGHGTLTVTDGTVSGFDLFRLGLSVQRPDLKSVETAASDALRTGATGFDRLELGANVAHGDLTLEPGSGLASATGEAHISGGVNLPSGALDIRIALQPALPSPPEVGIHLTGSIDKLNRTLELAGLARWMAELVR
jgi:hypothetical protein